MPDPVMAQNMDAVIADGLRRAAMKDVVNASLVGLGVGVAGRSAVGLYDLLKGRPKPRETTNGPAEVPLPIPVAGPPGALKAAAITTRSGLPWYYPATILGAAGAAYGGWKAIDHVLDSRAKQEREEELNRTRAEFHDALIRQYDAPVKLAADAGVGPRLDALFDRVEEVFEKAAANLEDWTNRGLGMYATYAIPAALWSGAMAYEHAKKTSNKAVLDAALQRRDRRKFTQQPPEIYAVPEPFEVPGPPEE